MDIETIKLSAMKTSIRFIPVWKRIYEISSSKIAYDIGGQTGVYASILRQIGFDVHVFEPSNNYNEILKKDFKDKFHPVAISDKNEILDSELNDCTKRGNLNYKPQKINFVVLDDYSLDLPKPDFIKIDIEGMESLAFKGMKKTLDLKPIIQLEYHKSIPYKGKNYPGFVDIDNGGFDFKSLLSDYLIFDHKLKITSMDRHANFFLIPKSNSILKSLV